MYKVLIGSKAIKHHFPDFPREPKDTDYVVCDSPYWKNTPGVELLKNEVIADLYHNKGGVEVISANHLITLKASHLCWDIGWEKHMFDVQFLLKKGCEINTTLFWELYDFWNVHHGKNKRSDLKMSKEDFFTNSVNYDTCEHDEMHKILNPVPIYTTILIEGKEVELSEEKYNTLTKEQKINLVREEVMVMAYERYKGLGYQRAYSRMLKKFIISHAPKFTLLFILENYIELHKPKFNFTEKIKNGINQHQSIK